MSQTSSTAALSPGQIVFYDNCVPGLPAGDYLINVTQRVNPGGAGAGIDETFVASQGFSVQGPRYTLPPEDIFSVFPPENAQGIFDKSLPNIVFTKRELPWERDFYAPGDAPAGGDPDSTRPPWMALLLFVEDEEIGGQKVLLEPQMPGWTANRNMIGTLPASAFLNPAAAGGIQWPALPAEWYETNDFLKTPCNFIDISAAGFMKLVPQPADLRYLAHVRQVDSSAKDEEVLKISGDGFYSVLMANRMPDPPPAGSGSTSGGRRNIMHLVSLEGLDSCITNPSNLNGNTRVRMISFKSWSFNCLPEMGESFSELMNGLLADAQGTPKTTSFILPTPPLPISPSAEEMYAFQSIQNGYTPLRYQTRLGDETVAWYRGPFSPVPVANFISTPKQQVGWQPYDTASSAMIYNKDYGMFDVSYAVAWETGRLLALADGLFGQQLLDWQRKGHALIDIVLERQQQYTALNGIDIVNDPKAEANFLSLVQPHAMTDPFMAYLVGQLSAQIVPTLTSPATPIPAAVAPSFPPYVDTDTVNSTPATIEQLLTDPTIFAAIRDIGGQELESIADWLAQLYLLIRVPFENLVPHASLLPPESIRFFYLDPNWQAALVEGALSIGIESSRDSFYQDLMKDMIWDSVFTAVQQVRSTMLVSHGGSAPAGSTVTFAQESLSGMLLRSSAVSGWPGMQFNAFLSTLPKTPTPDTSTQMQPLRLLKLSSDILLALWPAIPAVATIEEPHEGIAFGFEDAPSGEDFYLYLRSVTQDASYGKLNGAGIDAKAMINSLGVLNISGNGGLLQALANQLHVSSLSVRDFAIQMIRVPEQAIFATPQGH